MMLHFNMFFFIKYNNNYCKTKRKEFLNTLSSQNEPEPTHFLEPSYLDCVIFRHLYRSHFMYQVGYVLAKKLETRIFPFNKEQDIQWQRKYYEERRQLEMIIPFRPKLQIYSYTTFHINCVDVFECLRMCVRNIIWVHGRHKMFKYMILIHTSSSCIHDFLWGHIMYRKES